MRETKYEFKIVVGGVGPRPREIQRHEHCLRRNVLLRFLADAGSLKGRKSFQTIQHWSCSATPLKHVTTATER